MKKTIFSFIISGLLFAGCAQKVVTSLPSPVPSASPSVVKQDNVVCPQNLSRQFRSEIITFCHPADWSISDQAGGIFVLSNREFPLMRIYVDPNTDKTGKLVQPSDYMDKSNSKTADLKKNENPVDGHKAVEFTENPQGILSPPVEALVIAVPERSANILIEFNPQVATTDRAGLDKQVQEIFVPIISTIKVH